MICVRHCLWHDWGLKLCDTEFSIFHLKSRVLYIIFRPIYYTEQLILNKQSSLEQSILRSTISEDLFSFRTLFHFMLSQNMFFSITQFIVDFVFFSSLCHNNVLILRDAISSSTRSSHRILSLPKLARFSHEYYLKYEFILKCLIFETFFF